MADLDPSQDQAQSLVLEELVDPSGRLGIAYQKRSDGPYPPLGFAEPIAFFARLSSRFTIRAPKTPVTLLDAYVFALVPAGDVLQMTGDTAIADGVAFVPSRELLGSVGKDYGVPLVERLAALSELVVLPRTNWLNEVMHRYVFERVVARNRANKATTFLEDEIVKELYYRLDEHQREGGGRSDLDTFQGGRGSVLRRAMDFIEANLFRDIAVREIAARSGVSESTLLREFQKRLKKSPLNYVIDRRLEEAMILIKSQRYAVGQVSDMVGYENVSAFSAAFKKRFGVSPSQAAGSTRKET
jgi:AraC-like DNA-binding protein